MAENPPANAGDLRDKGLIPGLGRSLEEDVATHSSILAWRMVVCDGGLVVYDPWGCKESDTTEVT